VSGVTSAGPSEKRAIAFWLLGVAALVFAMVVLGGLTRLTQSGLSIVEWKPVTGVVPPLSDAAWNAEFDKYKQFPEYQKLNRNMTLEQFKGIFWYEWSHRLLGRIIGAAYLLPFLWFLFRRRVDKGLAFKLTGLLALGGLQGFVGWWMVASGLVDKPDVSHYRLTVHLGLAVLLYAALIWLALDLMRPPAQEGKVDGLGLAVIVLVYLQILSGALVAGLDAGFGWNTWPLMFDRIAPEQWLDLDPWWLNFFENTAAVQFSHRTSAYIVLGAALWLWHTRRKFETTSAPARKALGALHGVVWLQFGLGVATVLSFVEVGIAALHQGGALVLLTSSLVAVHFLPRRGA